MSNRWPIVLLVGACLASRAATAAVPNSLVLNEINTVSNLAFLDQDRPGGARNRADLTLGRLQGNGQNWLEFLVVQGDDLGGGAFANTLDLRGWKIEWQYDKPPLVPTDPDPEIYGAGVIEFTNEALWAAVPKGTLLMVSEWKQVWYHDAGTDPAGFGGLQRDGGINGLGEVVGDPYDANVHTKLVDFSTDLRWNPASTTPDGVHTGQTGDWAIRVWAGERNPDNSFKYFNFSGSIVNGDPSMPIAVGTTEGGLYAVNNDEWEYTILEPVEGGPDSVIQGPIGEAHSLGSFRVGADELFRLENFPVRTPPATPDDYLGVVVSDYVDGTSSAFGRPNVWSGGSFVQDLSSMRNYTVNAGDATLDGRADAADFLTWQRNVASTSAGLLQGDFDGDGSVTAADLTIWKGQFGSAAVAAVTAVPEGATGALAATGYLGCFMARRRLVARHKARVL
jgi:hypothetical protein